VPNRIVAVGDVHGEYDKLTSLLNKIVSYGIDLDTERVIFLSDHEDKGGDSTLVVSALIQLQELYPHWSSPPGDREQEVIRIWEFANKMEIDMQRVFDGKGVGPITAIVIDPYRPGWYDFIRSE
jgi:hypothetical protein